MNTKHTQGDWYARDGQIYPTDTGKTLALIPYYDKDNEEHEANARLIANAPELLAALIYIVNCNSEIGEDAVLDAKGYNMACDAINKATQL
jgi:hypothetical protein